MKVLSLLQPWASLVVTAKPNSFCGCRPRGIKQWETRCWRPRDEKLIDRLRTEGFLIHASAKWKMKGQAQLLNRWPFDQYEYDYAMDFGAIIGHVKLVDILSTDEWVNDHFDEEEYHFGDYGPNRFAWLLAEPVLFETPIPAKDALSLWDFEAPESINQLINQ